MSPLHRKLLRDISAEKGRFLAVTFLVFLGITLFFSCWLGYRSLDTSYKETSEELKYNDFLINVSRAPDSVVDELKSVEGVESVLPRLVQEGGCFLPGGDNIVSKLIGLPAGERPPVNDVLIQEGRYFQPGDEDACLVESHLADFYHIEPGDTLQVVTPAGKKELEIVGTAASAEFFMVSGEGSEIIASPRNYGVLFVPQAWLQGAFGWEGSSSQFCFLTDEGQDASGVMSRAEEVLSPYGVLYASLGDETRARQMLDLDVQGFKQMSEFFPILFLVVAALSLFMILTRMVHTQRPQIGTMMALGCGRWRIVSHYMSYALLVGLAGSAVGLGIGYVLGMWMTRMYASRLGIPMVTTTMDWAAAAEGFIAAMAVCVLASFLPIRRMVKIPPAQVMREDGGEKAGRRVRRSFLERMIPPLSRLSTTCKMPLRNLSRDRRRALFNVMGIVLALTLIVVSLCLLDSMTDIFTFQFKEVTRYDANVFFTSPEPVSEAEGLSGIPGVSRVEPYLEMPCRFLRDGEVLGEGLLDGLQEDTQLIGLFDTGGHALELPDQGVLLSNWFCDGLGVREGDTIQVETSVGKLDVEVKGFAKQFGGLTMFANLSWLQGVAGSDYVNGAYVASSSPGGEELREELLEAGNVAGVEIPEFTREMLRSEMMGMMYFFAGMMIFFAVAMGIALVYNTVSIAYLEREKEVSVMLALGSSVRRIAGMFTAENVIVALAGLLPGVALGYILSRLMMELFRNEFFNAPAIIKGSSIAIAVAGILVVVLLAELPSLRRARYTDIARMIKERSQ